jgi:hypothetical protein
MQKIDLTATCPQRQADLFPGVEAMASEIEQLGRRGNARWRVELALGPIAKELPSHRRRCIHMAYEFCNVLAHPAQVIGIEAARINAD